MKISLDDIPFDKFEAYTLICHKKFKNYFYFSQNADNDDYIHVYFYTSYIKDELIRFYENEIPFILVCSDFKYTYDGDDIYDKYIECDLNPVDENYNNYVNSRKYSIEYISNIISETDVTDIKICLSEKLKLYFNNSYDSLTADGLIDIVLLKKDLLKNLLKDLRNANIPHMIMIGFYEQIYIGINDEYHKYNNYSLIIDISDEMINNYKLLSTI